MALPTDWATIIFTGKVVTSLGDPAQGTVQFVLSTRGISTSTKTNVIPKTHTATINNLDGTYSITLPATDDPDIIPSGMYYTYNEVLTDGGGITGLQIEVPRNSPGGTVDLTAVIAGITPAPAIVSYATVQYVNDQIATVSSSGSFLPINGGTLTGDLKLNGVTANVDRKVMIAAPTTKKKSLEFGNAVDGTAPRWSVQQGTGTESGSNAGSDFEIARYNDAGTLQGNPITIARSSGRTTIGGTDGSQGGLDVRRNAGGTALNNVHSAAGGVAYGATVADAASKVLSGGISGDTVNRITIGGDGKIEWGPGASGTRDVNLYRDAANSLITDDAFAVAGKFKLTGAFAPATASSNGVQGEIAWDSSYIYVCVAPNTWKRSALTTW